jgi:hypothetical protein
MIADAFERSAVLGEKPARDRRIALGVAHAQLAPRRRGGMDEDQRSSSAAPDATMLRNRIDTVDFNDE